MKKEIEEPKKTTEVNPVSTPAPDFESGVHDAPESPKPPKAVNPVKPVNPPKAAKPVSGSRIPKPKADKEAAIRDKIIGQGFGPTKEQRLDSFRKLDHRLLDSFPAERIDFSYDAYEEGDYDQPENAWVIHTSGKGPRRSNYIGQRPDGLYKYSYKKGTHDGEEVVEDELDDEGVVRVFDDIFRNIEHEKSVKAGFEEDGEDWEELEKSARDYDPEKEEEERRRLRKEENLKEMTEFLRSLGYSERDVRKILKRIGYIKR